MILDKFMLQIYSLKWYALYLASDDGDKVKNIYIYKNAQYF